MNSTKRAARIAGVLYLMASIPGAFGLIYVPSVLIVSGDAAATARNIAASETLFRAGILAHVIGQACFIFVAFALYRLLKGVNQRLAVLMVTLIVVSIPISLVNELNHVAVLRLASASGPAAALGEAQRMAWPISSCALWQRNLNRRDPRRIEAPGGRQLAGHPAAALRRPATPTSKGKRGDRQHACIDTQPESCYWCLRDVARDDQGFDDGRVVPGPGHLRRT